MYAVNPEFCQKMQMQIINILLQDVYVTPDSWLQKAKILVRKGRWLKLYGINGLKDCICCLTEAITLLVSNQVILFFMISQYLLFGLECEYFIFGVGFLTDMN